MKKIKVLHITETFATGVYIYIKDLTNYLDKEKGFRSFIIYSGNREGTEKNRFSGDFPSNVKFYEIDMVREIKPITDLKSVISLIRLIKKIKPNIIHCHSSKGGVLGRVAAFFFWNIKVYYTPHGYSFLREDVSFLKKKLFYFIEKISSTIFSGTIVACGDTEYEYSKKLGKSELVRNGVAINEVSKYMTDKKDKANFIIGTIGRISYQKNPSLFNRIATSFPNVKFVWVGNGNLRNELISKNITVTGWKTREEALRIANTYDVYLQTSLWEGLPITIIEAMALGKPVLATNIIGNKDAVLNNKTGYLCYSESDFKDKIDIFLNNPDLILKMGKASIKRAQTKFNIQENFKKLKELYLR